MKQEQEKEEIVPNNFGSVYSAVNATLKTSNNKHLVDLIFKCPRIKLSQSDKIISDNIDTQQPIVDLCVHKTKKTPIFQIFTLIFWKQLNFHLNLLLRRMPKKKTDELRSLSKSDEVSLNRLYSCFRTAYDSIQNLSKARDLSKKK